MWEAGSFETASPKLLRLCSARLRIANCWVLAGVGVGAQRTEVGVRIGPADHSQRSSVMLTVERREVRWVNTVRGILGIVEPETDVEGIGWGQSDSGIEAEDLIQQNGLDPHVTGWFLFSDFDIRLIPGQAEVGKS